MWAKKIQWKTVDDSTGDMLLGDDSTGITLEKQRIRTFEIEYVVSENSMIIQ